MLFSLISHTHESQHTCASCSLLPPTILLKRNGDASSPIPPRQKRADQRPKTKDQRPNFFQEKNDQEMHHKHEQFQNLRLTAVTNSVDLSPGLPQRPSPTAMQMAEFSLSPISLCKCNAPS